MAQEVHIAVRAEVLPQRLPWDGQRLPKGEAVLEVEPDRITNVPHDLLVCPSLRVTALKLRPGRHVPGAIPLDHGGHLEPALHLLRWPSCKATDRQIPQPGSRNRLASSPSMAAASA